MEKNNANNGFMPLKTKMDFVLNDLRGAIDQSNREKRTYNKTSQHKYVPEHARFKAIIWFNDGNRRIYYSYDSVYFDKTAHVDEWRGVKKLIDLIATHKDKFKNAQIYCTLDPERKKTSNYNYLIYWAKHTGDVEANKALTFATQGQNTVAVLTKLEMYSGKNFVK